MPSASPSVLIIGVSRGLGFAMAEEFLRRGWNVLGTVRQATGTKLHLLGQRAGGRLQIERLEITDQNQIAELRHRLDGRRFDILFVNAGILTDTDRTMKEVTTENFNRLMVTNALSPLRALEVFQDLVPERGTIGVMSSGLGSITENADGVWDAYSASKAALNMLMRGFASRHARKGCAIVIMAPGWVRTDMGGPEADLEITESIPGVVDTITGQSGKPGLRFLDYTGRAVAW
jgi:NAD(P)-dependent dehydrogenase (short-subunit alcohol dehydrogenase family)